MARIRVYRLANAPAKDTQKEGNAQNAKMATTILQVATLMVVFRVNVIPLELRIEIFHAISELANATVRQMFTL